jgi:hypothetical protein
MSGTPTRPPSRERRNLTFAPEVAAYLDSTPNASATANAAVLAAMQAQAERDALAAFVAELDERYGPADPDEVARAIALLA